MTERLKEDIISGFRKTGIVPLDRNQVIARLPKRPGEGSGDTSLISEVFLENLKEMSYPNDEPARKRRKRVAVSPGKSIGLQAFDTLPSTSGEVRAQTSTSAPPDECDVRCETDDQNEGSVADESGSDRESEQEGSDGNGEVEIPLLETGFWWNMW